MSLEKEETFVSVLEAVLREAGLPTDLSKIIGCIYRFDCKHYDQSRHILIGTIQAIEISEGKGLSFLVSNPRLVDREIIDIRHRDGKWKAHVTYLPDNKIRFFEGKFTLYANL